VWFPKGTNLPPCGTCQLDAEYLVGEQGREGSREEAGSARRPKGRPRMRSWGKPRNPRARLPNPQHWMRMRMPSQWRSDSLHPLSPVSIPHFSCQHKQRNVSITPPLPRITNEARRGPSQTSHVKPGCSSYLDAAFACKCGREIGRGAGAVASEPNAPPPLDFLNKQCSDTSAFVSGNDHVLP